MTPPSPPRAAGRRRLSPSLRALVCAAPLLGATTEPATPDVGIQAWRALLIGVADYADPRIADLSTPVEDVQRISGILQNRYGFEVKVLSGPQATRKGIIDALGRLRVEASEKDAVLVYFAGHGTWDAAAQEGYWLPQDATADSDAGWVSNSDLAGKLRAIPARHVFLISDACFSGSLFRDVGKARSVEGPTEEAVATRLAALRSRQVMTSGGNEPVVDQYRDGLSVFAYFLAEALDHPSAPYVTFDAVFPVVRERVMVNARQTPRMGSFHGTGDEGGQLVLVDRSSRPNKAAGRPVTGPPTAEDALLVRFGARMVRVPAGSFWMGAGESDKAAGPQERPRHQVSLSRGFRVMDTEVSQSLFEAVLGRNPSANRECGGRCPVENVSWSEAIDFANALSSAENLEKCYVRGPEGWTWPAGPACLGYRLPTEAEWEYVARAGGDTPFAGSDDPGEVGWHVGNSGGTSHPARGRVANPWGLFDLSGNVWEWTWDGYRAYAAAPVLDPVGPAVARERVFRGGSWLYDQARSRVTWRGYAIPEQRQADLGFRLVRSEP